MVFFRATCQMTPNPNTPPSNSIVVLWNPVPTTVSRFSPSTSQDNPYFTQQAGKARWTLSEAEDERGAGLWVWGLFEEPLYPFLLLQVNNLEIVRYFHAAHRVRVVRRSKKKQRPAGASVRLCVDSTRFVTLMKSRFRPLPEACTLLRARFYVDFLP